METQTRTKSLKALRNRNLEGHMQCLRELHRLCVLILVREQDTGILGQSDSDLEVTSRTPMVAYIVECQAPQSRFSRADVSLVRSMAIEQMRKNQSHFFGPFGFQPWNIWLLASFGLRGRIVHLRRLHLHSREDGSSPLLLSLVVEAVNNLALAACQVHCHAHSLRNGSNALLRCAHLLPHFGHCEFGQFSHGCWLRRRHFALRLSADPLLNLSLSLQVQSAGAMVPRATASRVTRRANQRCLELNRQLSAASKVLVPWVSVLCHSYTGTHNLQAYVRGHKHLVSILDPYLCKAG